MDGTSGRVSLEDVYIDDDNSMNRLKMQFKRGYTKYNKDNKNSNSL